MSNKKGATNRTKRFVGRDLDLSQLQSWPYRVVYIHSDSPTAKDVTHNNITRNGENLTKTDYAKILDKRYGPNR